VDRFVQALQSFGIGRLAAILGVSAAVAAGLFILAFNIGAQPQGLLYSGLDLREAGSIGEALDQAGIKYKAVGDGSTIMVPRDKVAQARIEVASKGLVTSGSVGYELFDQGNGLGQTDFVNRLNRQRALEGELARTLRGINGVTYARVSLTMPQRQLFEEESSPPTAAVVIGAGRALDASQVRSVQNIISASVPSLKPDQVAVIDQATGKTLAGGGEGEGALGAVTAERHSQVEEGLRKRIREMVEGVVGPGKARVTLTADIDMARVTTQEEKFDPDGQVARSTSAISSEESDGSSSGVGDGVTAANNLPGADTGEGAGGNSSSNTRTEETSNFEISKTTRTEVIEPGAIKKLAVGIALDGVPPATATQIEELVKSSLGIGTREGDTLKVINVKFATPAAAPGGAEAKSMLAAFDKNDIMRGAELGVLVVVAALIIFFVVRPLLKTAGGGGLQPMPMLAQAAGGAEGYAGGQVSYQGGAGGHAQIQMPPTEGGIDMARIEGQVRTSSVKQVSEFVERHPEESVSILRSWLHEA